MKNRQYPNLVFPNNVIDAVELEPVYRGATHVFKSDSVKER